MRIAFLDTQKLDYTADTPFQKPLGGSQSAMCYLAIELARLGHEVAVLNGTATPGKFRGVHFFNFARFEQEYLQRCNVLIVLNWPQGVRLRQQFGLKLPLVLWLSHAADQPVVSRLSQAEERDAWSGFSFVSDWQKRGFVDQFRIPPEKGRVIRYAISPPFADTPVAPAWFERGEAPILAYTSTPFRGLDVLLAAFREIRSTIPDVRLRVFSSMALYQVAAAQDQYAQLYAQCAAMDGVEYCGPVGQARLAQELRGIAGLAYPSTFAETSCISVLEAMAAGGFIFTTRFGALPETTSGFAYMVDFELDQETLAKRFAAMTIRALRELQDDPAAASLRRNAQVSFVRDQYCWPARAAEWVAWLAQAVGR